MTPSSEFVNSADVGLSLHKSTLNIFSPESQASHLGSVNDVPWTECSVSTTPVAQVLGDDVHGECASFPASNTPAMLQLNILPAEISWASPAQQVLPSQDGYMGAAKGIWNLESHRRCELGYREEVVANPL